LLDQFADLDRHYPGSRERRQTVASAPASGVQEDQLGKPLILVLRGRDTEFFTIGQVAAAIGRKAGTLRAWENKGVLPTSGYTKPSDDPRGRRRLYTRPQAEGIIRLAKSHNVMDADSRRPLNAFSRDVIALFAELRRK
jgi:hypothetical protein